MKKTLLALAAAIFISAIASAVPIQLTPSGTTVLSTYYIAKNGTGIAGGNSNNSANQLHRLNTYFLAVPFVPSASLKPATQTHDWSSGGLAGWDYAVIHFGGGAFGGAGGSVGAWDLNGADTFVFPNQSFSSIDFYRDVPKSVPDSGTTFALLGAALVALSAFRSRKS